MAEALFNHFSSDLLNLSANSCGIYADGVSEMSDNAKLALNEIGIDSEHISTPVSEELIQTSDYVIGMTSNHAKTLISMFPEYEDKIYAMPLDISDPYGGNIEIYRQCRDELSLCVKELIKTILGEYND